MNDYNNQIGKNMKLNALVSITYLIEQHKAKLEKLGEKEIENLSIVRVRAYARENGYCYGMWIVVVNVR